MEKGKTDFGKSVTAVVIRDGKVLLGRHTYGRGAGKLIIPGGYLEEGETPEEALKREYLEETGIDIEPREIIGIRFNDKDWYVAYRADYVSGVARSDNDENSEVIWVDVYEALLRDDVPDLSKKLIASAIGDGDGLARSEFLTNSDRPNILYRC